MKGAGSYALLPLVASAAVIPEAGLTRRQQGGAPLGDKLLGNLGSWLGPGDQPKADAGKTWGDTFAQLGGYIDKGYQMVNGASQGYQQMQDQIEKQLPGLLSSAVPNLAILLQWVAQPAQAVSIKAELEPAIARKVALRYGPFVLTGQKYNKTTAIPFLMDAKSEIIIRQLKGIPQNAAILSGRMDTVTEDGTKLDVAQGIYIHHLLVADVGKNTAPFAACPGGRNQKTLPHWISYHVVNAVGAGLVQSGNDQVGDANMYYNKGSDKKSAFLTSFDDAFLLEAEIVNYNQENTTVYLQFETEYIPERPKEYADASTVLFSTTGCGNPGYRPEKGAKKYNYTSDPFIMENDGYFINNRGHLHDGGVAMQMTLNDKLICESKPTYGGAPGATKSPDGKEWQTILGMSRCDETVPFRKGDSIKLISIYDVDLHPLRPSGGESHGHSGDKTESADPHGGMEGMEEMGIFTANIVMNNPNYQPIQQPKAPKAPAALPAPAAAPVAPAAAPKNSAGSATTSMPKGMEGMAHSHSKRRSLLPKAIKDGEPLAEAIWPVVVDV